METKRKSVKLNASMKNNVLRCMLDQFDIKHEINIDDVKSAVKKVIISKIPLDVMELFNKYKGSYMHASNYFSIYYNKDEVTVRLDISIPVDRTNLNLSKLDRNKDTEILFNYMEYRDNRTKFRDSIEYVLSTVNTTNQLIDKLPIAENYLPSNEIMVSGQLVPVTQIKFITDMLK